MTAETSLPGIHVGATVIKHWWECYTCGECPDAVEDERAEAAAHTTETGHTTSYHRSEGRYLMPKRDNTGPPADVVAGPRTGPLADQVVGSPDGTIAAGEDQARRADFIRSMGNPPTMP